MKDPILSDADALRILVPPRGFIHDYVHYAYARTDAPVLYHVGFAIALLAATVPAGLHIWADGGRKYPNLYMLVVGDSATARKSTAMGIATDILLEVASARFGGSPGSYEGLLRSLEEHSQQTIMESEFSRFLKQAQGNGHLHALKQGYLDVYDCLDSDTEVLTEDGWRGRSQVAVGDRVYALNRDTGCLELVPVTDRGDRAVRPGERMVRIKTNMADVRVTEGHQVYAKYVDARKRGSTRDGSKLSDTWLDFKARDLVERGSPYALPLAAEMAEPYPGVPLTDGEIRLIAWYLTDGRIKDDTKLEITQSKPHTIERVRGLLNGLELDFTEREIPPEKRSAGTYDNAQPQVVFTVPKGTHTGTLARRGWDKLAPWLDKAVPVGFHTMTRRQFEVLWDELLLGDGASQPREGSHKWRGAHLWCSDEVQANTYTWLATVRGFAAGYGAQETDNGHTMYVVSVRDAQWLTSNPADPRVDNAPVFETPDPVERVWCLTNKHGTLVTRREGRIAILGNCKPVSKITANRSVNVTSPRLSLVGAIAPSLLEQYLEKADLTGGFWSRFLILEGVRDRFMPWTEPDEDAEQAVIAQLHRRFQYTPCGRGFHTPPVKAAMDAWATNLDATIRDHELLGDEQRSLFGRASGLLHRLSLLFAVDRYVDTLPEDAPRPSAVEPPSIPIIESDLRHAAALVGVHVNCSFSILADLADTRDMRHRRDVLRTIGSIPESVGPISERSKLLKGRTMQILDTLVAQGKVVVTQGSSGDQCYVRNKNVQEAEKPIDALEASMSWLDGITPEAAEAVKPRAERGSAAPAAQAQPQAAPQSDADAQRDADAQPEPEHIRSTSTRFRPMPAPWTPQPRGELIKFPPAPLVPGEPED